VDEERGALVRARLTKAERKLAAARADLEASRFDEAVSRAYYAMFHAVRAALAARGVQAKTHSGLAALFAEQLVRTGEIDAELGRWLGQARRNREIGDYDDFLAIDPEEAVEAVSRASMFLEELRAWLARSGYAAASE